MYRGEMKNNRCLWPALCILFLFSITVTAQPETKKTVDVQNLATPVKSATPPLPMASYIEIDNWEGKRFIFMPSPKAAEQGNYDNFSGSIKRKIYQGRIAKVTMLENFSGMRHMVFEMEDSKEQLKAKTETIIGGMVSVDDIAFASEQWKGKTFWCKEIAIAVYNEESDQVDQLRIKKHSAVKVLDVVPAWNEDRPVRLIVEMVDGAKGFVDINVSGTNVPEDFRHKNLFNQSFNLEDPRKLHNWPANIWNLIESAQITDGMTKEQVVMSWGEPESINRTKGGEHWQYPSTVLIFKGAKLAGIR